MTSMRFVASIIAGAVAALSLGAATTAWVSDSGAFTYEVSASVDFGTPTQEVVRNPAVSSESTSSIASNTTESDISPQPEEQENLHDFDEEPHESETDSAIPPGQSEKLTTHPTTTTTTTTNSTTIAATTTTVPPVATSGAASTTTTTSTTVTTVSEGPSLSESGNDPQDPYVPVGD